MRTYKFRLYPSKKQITLLNLTIEQCRLLYNHLLEQRINEYKETKHSFTAFDQIQYTTQLKKSQTEWDELNNIYAQTLQDVAMRLDNSFKNFFRRIKNGGEKPGFPRFKSKDRFNSFTYPQYSTGFRLTENNTRIYLPKIGYIKFKYSQEIKGNIKIATIKRTFTNKWFISIVCENEILETLPKTGSQIGIDLGISQFATFSNGTKIENPKFFKREEENLAKAQQKFSKNKSKKNKKVVSRIHERITNKRNNFSHQLSNKIIKEHDFIVLEDLNINNLLKQKKLSKSIADVAWNDFIQKLIYKAESAGKLVIKVNPAYTSQTCSNCGIIHKIDLSGRIFNCIDCNFFIDRDLNAAINIFGLGLQSIKV